ncbi:MAG: hypothetical protein ACRECG_12740, partial [Bradyrhizobium sp.]
MDSVEIPTDVAKYDASCGTGQRISATHPRHSGARLFLGASPESISPRLLRPNGFRACAKASGASRNDKLSHEL